MLELYRNRELIRVALYQGILEAEGIPTIIRNEHLTNSGITDIPIPEFYPALCVVSDDDYPTARRILLEHLRQQNQPCPEDRPCTSCGEPNPGNFECCWSCGSPMPTEPQQDGSTESPKTP